MKYRVNSEGGNIRIVDIDNVCNDLYVKATLSCKKETDCFYTITIVDFKGNTIALDLNDIVEINDVAVENPTCNDFENFLVTEEVIEEVIEEKQLLGHWSQDYAAVDADIIIDKAKLIQDAIASGAVVGDEYNNAVRALQTSDKIFYIDADLLGKKNPKSGYNEALLPDGTTFVPTNGDGEWYSNGGEQQWDEYGSKTNGCLTAKSGFKIETQFDKMVIKKGSAVRVSLEFGSLPYQE